MQSLFQRVTFKRPNLISGTADEGPYRVLLEGLESFAAVLRVGMLEDDETKNYGYTPSGQKYLSARR